MDVLIEKQSNLVGALLGKGASSGDLQNLLRVETGQMAADTSRNMPPSALGKADKQMRKQVKSVLTTSPDHSIFVRENQHNSSYPDFTWLTAGPKFLIGIKDEDNQLHATQADAIESYRAGVGNRGMGNSGKSRINLGERGKQRIYQVNRILVSKSAMKGVMESIKSKFGQLKASFARTTNELLGTNSFPAWVTKQIPNVVSNGKSVFTDASRSSETEGFIVFGSRASGVVNNPAVNGKINSSIARRVYITKEKLAKILKGYSYDWNNGRVFKSNDDVINN